MRFVSTREMRNNPSKFRDAVGRDDVVLTANGKPFAVVVGVAEDDLEETVELLRQVRALRAMARMQQKSVESGSSGLSMEEIDEEIRASRRSRRRSA